MTTIIETSTASARVSAAVAAIRAGRPVVVLDDADRENEADLIMAAEFADQEMVAFFVRHTSGFLCVALPEHRTAALDLPLMVVENSDSFGTAFTVSVDAVGTGTGISARSRATTIRDLADPGRSSSDFARPGHVMPLRAHPRLLASRRGHTEAAVALCRSAGVSEAGLLCELTTADQTEMMNGDQARLFAAEHDLVFVTIDDLTEFASPPAARTFSTSAAGVWVSPGTELPTPWGVFTATTFSGRDGIEHLALTWGVADRPGSLVRVHSECLTGESLHSLRCDCAAQLDSALQLIAESPGGILLYLRGHEGRGIGLGAKIAAYRLQDHGRDTIEANLALGFPADAREYTTAAEFLVRYGATDIELLTNNPAKADALRDAGISLRRILPTVVHRTDHNGRYLSTKQARMGHHLHDTSHTPAADGPPWRFNARIR